MFGNLNYYLNVEYLLAAKTDFVLTIVFFFALLLERKGVKHKGRDCGQPLCSGIGRCASACCIFFAEVADKRREVCKRKGGFWSRRNNIFDMAGRVKKGVTNR